MSSTAARHTRNGPLQAILSWLADFRRGIRPYGRRMTTEERRRFAREAAKDPRVDQALQELYAERPYLRQRDTRRRAVRR
jgi:hypothetical protein